METMALKALCEKLLRESGEKDEELAEMAQRNATLEEEMKKKDEELAELKKVQNEERIPPPSLEVALAHCSPPLANSIRLARFAHQHLNANKKSPKDVGELAKIINNPTFTILQDEEGARPADSPLGKAPGMKKCRIYPGIEKWHGTGYLRWIVEDTTYYLTGESGCIKIAKTNEIANLQQKGGDGHINAKDMRRVGRALYSGLSSIHLD